MDNYQESTFYPLGNFLNPVSIIYTRVFSKKMLLRILLIVAIVFLYQGEPDAWH
jgi:hypothetical protein